MAASHRDLIRLLESLDGPITAAFLADALGIKDRAVITLMVSAIEANDMDALERALGFRPGSWGQLTESIRQAYIDAGIYVMAANVPARFGAVFDFTNPRAEAWLRQHSSQLVTFINSEQREALRIVLEAGMSAGRSPRQISLDIIGRVNKATGRREGGIIGLNAPQAQAAMNARDDLENLSSNYFTRERRDRRFDSIVRKAIESGTPLTQTDINRIVGRYEDRLLKLRGDTVGRTEALQSMNEASDESLRQVIDEGLAPRDAVRRVWDATGDARTRPAHMAADGQERGVDELFDVGGAPMMHPGDGDHGAGPGNIINCRCVVRHEIDFGAVELARLQAA